MAKPKAALRVRPRRDRRVGHASDREGGLDHDNETRHEQDEEERHLKLPPSRHLARLWSARSALWADRSLSVGSGRGAGLMDETQTARALPLTCNTVP